MDKIDLLQLPQSLNNTVFKYLLDLNKIVFSFNVTKNKLLYASKLEKNGIIYDLFKVNIGEENLNFDTLMEKYSLKADKEQQKEFAKFFNTANFVKCFECGNFNIVKTFKMQGVFQEVLIAEHHVILMKDEKSGDLFGCSFVFNKLYSDSEKETLSSMIKEAEIDILTGCFNRRKLESCIKDLLLNKDDNFAFFVIDIDSFKLANDIGGHKFGDYVLTEMSQIMNSTLKNGDILARMGGDEFVIIYKNVSNNEELNELANSLRQKCNKIFITQNGVKIPLSISIGVSLFPENATNYDSLYQMADDALYCAKSTSKNCYKIYSISNDKSNAEQFSSYCDADCRLILDSFTSLGLYVVEEKTNKILFFNKKFKEVVPHVEMGMNCKDLKIGPCKNCIIETMHGKDFAYKTIFSETFGNEVEVTANKILWRGYKPAILLSIVPHKQNKN